MTLFSDTPERRASRWLLALSSLVIIGMLTAQGLKSFNILCYPDRLSPPLPKALQVGCDPWVYPFMAYPMYSEINAPGSEVTQHRAFATLSDGSEIEIDAKDLDLANHQFRLLFDAAERGELDLAARIATIYAGRHPVEIERLRLEEWPTFIEAGSVVFGTPTIISDLPLSAMLEDAA